VTPVVATGTHDTASAVAAIPGLDQKSVYISSGTWSLMGMEVKEPVINERTLRFNVTNEGGVFGTIRLLKNIAGLWLVQESRRRWQRDGQDFSWDELAKLAEESAPFGSLVDPDAPDFLNPSDMPEAIRSFCRRTEQKEPATPGEVVRCCLESLALKYRSVLQTFAQLTGSPIDSVRVVGGGCRNRLLCRFTAEACGRPVITGPVEATALGNLMVQAIALGELSDLESGRKAIAGSVKQEYFQPTANQDWDEAYGRFKALVG
jgi:rhamnulokinase